MRYTTSVGRAGTAYHRYSKPGLSIAELQRASQRGRKVRSTFAELPRLGDKSVQDIGLERETLGPTARFAVYGK